MWLHALSNYSLFRFKVNAVCLSKNKLQKQLDNLQYEKRSEKERKCTSFD